VPLGAGEEVVAGCVLPMLVVKLNLLGFSALLDKSADGGLPMLIGFFGITFGMVGIAWRVMVLLPGEKD
jgi:hypothetical protein